MTRLIAALIRHGDYEQPVGVPSAHLPHPLTAQGEAQAREAVEAVQALAREQGWRIHPVIDSSRMLRAWQTASILCEGLGAEEVQEFEALAERCVGAAANLTLNQIDAIVARDPRVPDLPRNWKYQSDFALPFQNAESMDDAGRRVSVHVESRLTALEGEVEGDTLKIFVGHGGAFRHAGAALGVLEPSRIPWLSMYHCTPVYLERRDSQYVHIAGRWKQREALPTRPD